MNGDDWRNGPFLTFDPETARIWCVMATDTEIRLAGGAVDGDTVRVATYGISDDVTLFVSNNYGEEIRRLAPAEARALSAALLLGADDVDPPARPT